jgi:hypothetical protein
MTVDPTVYLERYGYEPVAGRKPKKHGTMKLKYCLFQNRHPAPEARKVELFERFTV